MCHSSFRHPGGGASALNGTERGAAHTHGKVNSTRGNSVNSVSVQVWANMSSFFIGYRHTHVLYIRSSSCIVRWCLSKCARCTGGALYKDNLIGPQDAATWRALLSISYLPSYLENSLILFDDEASNDRVCVCVCTQTQIAPTNDLKVPHLNVTK